jgi:flagellum-specific ATP synthase
MVQVGAGLCGRILDALGQPLDGKPLPHGLVPTPVEQPAPNSLDRPPITSVLPTGVKAIDGLLTCGRGQRLGIFAGSGVGKSSLLAMLARGTEADVNVIALVGERGREVNEFIEHALGPAGVARSVLVVATSDAPAPLRVQAAATATAIAEWFRESGKQVLLIVDSITRLAHAQRELGLAAGEPPTTRGYPPSVFSLLPRLIERTGQTRRGAITAFYSVLVDGDDPDEPISDALRGLLDGHIVLSRRLASEGRYPAIDCLASLSRLQSAVAPPALREAATRVRRHLAELHRHEDLLAVGAYRAGSNPALDQAINARPAIEQFLAQPIQSIVPFAQIQQQITGL